MCSVIVSSAANVDSHLMDITKKAKMVSEGVSQAFKNQSSLVKLLAVSAMQCLVFHGVSKAGLPGRLARSCPLPSCNLEAAAAD